jgi:mannose-6-phosphate isomerase-like protein (cupin superfamily)
MNSPDMPQKSDPFASSLHEINKKSWGLEKWIVKNQFYPEKILFFNKGKRCSFHYHKIKTETFYLQKGRFRIHFSFEDEISTAQAVDLVPRQSFDVPVGLRHQALTLDHSEVFEFYTQHFESDSYRIMKGD